MVVVWWLVIIMWISWKSIYVRKLFYVPPNAMNNNTATSQGYKLCESLADETLGQELQLNKWYYFYDVYNAMYYNLFMDWIVFSMLQEFLYDSRILRNMKLIGKTRINKSASFKNNRKLGAWVVEHQHYPCI